MKNEMEKRSKNKDGHISSAKIIKFVEEKSRLAHSLSGFGSGRQSIEKWSAKENREDYYAVVPPLDKFMCVDKTEALNYVWKGFEKNDIVIGRISSIREHGLSVFLIALDGGKSRDIEGLKIRAWCPSSEIPKKTNHEDVLLRFSSGDLLRCVIVEINFDDQEIIVSQFQPPHSNSDVELGKIEDENLPVGYQRQISTEDPYEDILNKTVGFENPNNNKYLMSKLNIPQEEIVSLMRGLHKRHFPKQDFAEPLRKQQSQKYAEKSVKKGIEKFHSNNYVEALQDFNYALEIDTENVDALVARGALYANRNSFIRAMHDFEGALKLEPDHKNAKKYLVEVLVERAKQIEPQIVDVEQVKEVEKCYKRALQLDHKCEEARKALGEMEKKQEEERKLKLHSRSSSPSSNSDADKDKFAATAEKLRKMLKSDPVKKRRTISTESSKSKQHSQRSHSDIKVRNGRKRKVKKKSEDSSSSSDSSSDSSSSSSSSSSSGSTSSSSSHKNKKKKRSKSSSSSSSSSEDDRKRKKIRSRSRSNARNSIDLADHKKENLSRTQSETKTKSRNRENENMKRRLSSSSTDPQKKHPTSSRRHSDAAVELTKHHATIKSNASAHSKSRDGHLSSERRKSSSFQSSISPVRNSRNYETSRQTDRKETLNLSKITKDNFKNILNEISKFETVGKKGH